MNPHSIQSDSRPIPTRSDNMSKIFLNSGIRRYALFVAYSFLIVASYSYMSEWWAYIGFEYNSTNYLIIFLSCFIGSIPAIFLKEKAKTFSQSAAWLIYILVYLPASIIPVMQSFAGGKRDLLLCVSVALSGFLFVLICNFNVRRVNLPPLKSKFFWAIVLTAWFGLIAHVLVVFGSTIIFVNLDQIYVQRFSASRTVEGSAFISYSYSILANAIAPFFIVYGLFNKNYLLLFAGIATEIFLFGALAARATLLSPIFIIALWYILRTKSEFDGHFVLKSLMAVIVITMPFLLTYNPANGGINNLITLIYFRTLLISGAMLGVYDMVFQIEPLTYLSNNNIVNLFVDYPHGELSLGQVVMIHLVPESIWEYNLGQFNANFLATDGVAAFGVIGIPFASLLAAFMLIGLNKIIPDDRDLLMIAGGSVFILSLTNTSLLTSMVSGGGVLLCFLIAMAPKPRNYRKRIN